MSATFLGMAQELIEDVDAKTAFTEDPDGFLAARGFGGLSPEDLADAVGFVAETLPSEAAMAITDPVAGGDALARLTQLAPTAGADPEDDGGAAGGADFGVGLSGLAASDADDGDADEAPDDEDEELGAGFGTDDPSLLPDDPGHTAFDPLRDDEAAPGLGVGFGNEDVDDAAPPDPDALPDLGF